MVGDVVRAVGGRDVVVTVLMGPGTDPHLYKPTPADMRTLRDAEIVFASGLKLEGKMEDVFRDLGATKPVVFITDGVPRERLIAATEEEASHGQQHDPHVWFDVSLWAMTASPVQDALGALRPLKQPAFAANAEVFRTQLGVLHDEVAAAMAAIPQDRRVLVTAHDAFGYFGRAYGVEVLGVQGISTESEASLQTINQLVDTLVTRKVPAIFVETSVNPKGIEGLKQGAAARGHTVIIGGELFSDAMGAAGTDEGTYVGMVRHNARTIAAGLGGAATAATSDAKRSGGGS
jgi:manganese/zinc/iron transport system substrate-binding protein